MTRDRALTLTMICIGAMIGYLLGLATPEKAVPDPWLERWQTLIAGALAVVAAILTVFEMQRNERQQALRHGDLMKLTTRGDRLLALRACEPLADMIARQASLFDDNFQFIAKRKGRIADAANADKLRRLADTVATLKVIAEDEQFKDASHLFSPRMYNCYRGIRKISADADGKLTDADVAKRTRNLSSVDRTEAMYEYCLDRVRVVPEQLRFFSKELKALADEYR